MKLHGSKFFLSAALIVAFAALVLPLAQAQTDSAAGEADRVAKLKAAYILNFIKYTQWPAGSFENNDAPVIVTTVGDCDMHDSLREGARVTGPIGGRRIVVQRIAYPRPDASGTYDQREVDDFYGILQKSHVACFCAVEADSLRAVLQRLSGFNVLTVSDTSRFCENGGMLRLLIRENRMVFQANTGEIKKTQLEISAKMLKWAEIVQTRTPGASGAPGAAPSSAPGAAPASGRSVEGAPR